MKSDKPHIPYKPYLPGIDPDRRKGPDPLLKSLTWLAVAGWLLLFIALTLTEKAKPQLETYFNKRMNVSARTTWNMTLARYIFCAMWIGIILSGLGLIINATRHRRKDDRYRLSLLLLGIISFAGCFFYIFFFYLNP